MPLFVLEVSECKFFMESSHTSVNSQIYIILSFLIVLFYLAVSRGFYL